MKKTAAAICIMVVFVFAPALFAQQGSEKSGMPGPRSMAGPAGGCGPGCMCAAGMAGKKAPGMGGGIYSTTWPPMGRSCRTPEVYLALRDYLALDGEQVERLRGLLSGLEKDRITMGAKVRVLELELSDIVTRPDFKKADALDMLGDIETARTTLRARVIAASADARDVLSEEQLGLLSDLDLPPVSGGKPAVKGQKDMMMQRMREQMMRRDMP